MNHTRRAALSACSAIVLSALTIIGLQGIASAKKQPKVYPVEGKVVATGLYEFAVRKYTHTYNVVSDTRLYVLNCEEEPGLFSSTGPECGGDKKIQIGDIIHFRVEKSWAYISIVETAKSYSTYPKETVTREQRLRVLREELNPDSNNQNSPTGKSQPMTPGSKI